MTELLEPADRERAREGWAALASVLTSPDVARGHATGTRTLAHPADRARPAVLIGSEPS
jgi:hypothetical protein